LAGRDLCGIAQTGTGKTAAFALPLLQRLSASGSRAQPGSCRALVLSPTRELASQIAESFKTYGRHLKLSSTVVFGGVSGRPQAQALARGVDILVATPGRLTDHLNAGAVRLDRVEIFVLDEADRMLDMGFIHAIRRILPRLPKSRQNLFFSATMPHEIARLADELLRDPVKVTVTPGATTAEKVEQRVIFVPASSKRALLADILSREEMARTLVFTRTKHGADRVVRHLDSVGIRAAAIHGNKSQNQRERALDGFKSGRNRVLIATDIAARGIDIDAITHVVNFDLPNIPETYVHRIGRTARAGTAGIAISFCDAEEKAYLRDIEKLIRKALPASGSLEASAVTNGPFRAALGQDRARLPHAASRGQLRAAAARYDAAGPPPSARHGARRQGQGASAAGAVPDRDAIGHRRGKDGAGNRWRSRPR
ncbi:MAG: DEAD/DEAH box helicase, partial [Hyphomicrobiales bacterium]|nr:DEAD/DEAH box helicase [Hyphomicrobiales bacterium]